VRAGRALVLAVAALALAACGSAEPPGQRISGLTLTIYFAGPLHGASSSGASAALYGARVALESAHGRVGRYRIVLRVLDDSTRASRGWDPNQTTANVRVVTQDPTAIGYLGDFNSGASAISIPLLNRAGIPQVSPGSTAVGLTTDGTGAAPGEPQKYYPTGAQTFARVIPTDAVQALALVQVQRMLGCHSIFVLHDGEVDGEDTALTYVITAQSAGLRVVAVQAFKRGASSYRSVASSVAGSGADCVVLSAIDEPSAVLLTEQLAGAVPRATIFVANDLSDRAYTDPSDGGVPASLDSRLVVLSAALPPSAYPRSARVVLAHAPYTPAIFGYEAMRVMLTAIARATDDGRIQADRRKVLAALFSTRRPFTIDSAGDSSIDRYGVYRLVGGRMSFVEAAG
jgi:branched-chain amino acid transport system substrate-binding protein